MENRKGTQDEEKLRGFRNSRLQIPQPHGARKEVDRAFAIEYEWSHSLGGRLGFMIRTLFGWAVFVVSTVILGTAAIFLSIFDSSGNIPHQVARLWGKIQLWSAGCPVDISGLENIDPGKSYILVSNHQSTFDIFALLGHLPIQFRWIAKAELFRIPFLGWAMTRIGYIPIERESPKKAYRSMLAAAEAVKRGVSVIIFPEGTRSPDGKLQPFKKGLFLIALKSQAPILPISIQGTAGIMRKGDWRAHPGRVWITVDPPIETAGIPTEKEAELSRRVRETLEKNLSRGTEGATR